MFVSEPVNGLIYVARRRQRGGKLLIWTAVPVAPDPIRHWGNPSVVRSAETGLECRRFVLVGYRWVPRG